MAGDGGRVPDVSEQRAEVEMRTVADYPFLWQRVKVCPIYPEFVVVRGDYGLRLNRDAEEDDRGGRTAWEVWHWPSNTAESDWFTVGDALRAMAELLWPKEDGDA